MTKNAENTPKSGPETADSGPFFELDGAYFGANTGDAARVVDSLAAQIAQNMGISPQNEASGRISGDIPSSGAVVGRERAVLQERPLTGRVSSNAPATATIPRSLGEALCTPFHNLAEAMRTLGLNVAGVGASLGTLNSQLGNLDLAGIERRILAATVTEPPLVTRKGRYRVSTVALPRLPVAVYGSAGAADARQDVFETVIIDESGKRAPEDHGFMDHVRATSRDAALADHEEACRRVDDLLLDDEKQEEEEKCRRQHAAIVAAGQTFGPRRIRVRKK